MVALNYGETESHPERVSNIKPFIHKYNWKGINYLSKIDDWKRFEKNNLKIALNTLKKKKEIYPASISKHNPCKTNNSINDSKRRKRRMTLSCSKKFIRIIKWNNFKI